MKRDSLISFLVVFIVVCLWINNSMTYRNEIDPRIQKLEDQVKTLIDAEKERNKPAQAVAF